MVPWRPASRQVLSLLTLGGAALLHACAGGVGGEPEPPVSPTGKEYPLGTPPEETRFSQMAVVYLRSGDYDRALEIAREGIEADPENAVHYFLGGRAAVRLGEYEKADEFFLEAERIFPAYEIDIEPEREAAWRDAFNEGVEAYGEGDGSEALARWRDAALIHHLRPEAHRNLAEVLSSEGQNEEAIEVYEDMIEGLEREPATRMLSEEDEQERRQARNSAEERLAQLLLSQSRFDEAEPLIRAQINREGDDVELQSDLATALRGQGEEEEAAEIYSTLLEDEDVEASQLRNLGIALFRAEDYEQAAEAFRRVTGLWPHSREAWFNYANALFAAEDWDALLEVGERLVDVDPLNETAWTIHGRTLLEHGDEEGARESLARIDSAPVHIEGLSLSPGEHPTETETTVEGQVIGNAAEPGAEVRVRFTFYSGQEDVGSRTLTIEAPEPEEATFFELTFEGEATSYRYSLES